VWFHFVHSPVKFENRKNKKSFDERNGESDRRGDRSSIFIVKKARISTMVPVSCVSQDNIFHIHVRLDIWRCRTTRINVMLNVSHRKTTNSNGNQVWRVFSRTQWVFVCYETNGFDLALNITQSSDDRHRDPWSVNHRWEIHGNTWLPTRVHLPSLYVRLFDVSRFMSCFFWKNRYGIEIMWKFLWIIGNWIWTKIVKTHNLCDFEIHNLCDIKNYKDC
jgi:hypothetical protein